MEEAARSDQGPVESVEPSKKKKNCAWPVTIAEYASRRRQIANMKLKTLGIAA
jgi:hypothetical protein